MENQQQTTVEPYQRRSDRTQLLTVQKLIDYLKTQNPNACIVAFEMNSNAYTEQFPDLPNQYICTVKEDKEHERASLMHWYSGDEAVVKSKMDEIYRYVQDDDVVIRL